MSTPDFIQTKITARSFSYFGPKLVESQHVTEQFRFPRTKKRRIRNKWTARPENHRPRRGVLHDKVNNILYVHPQYIGVLKQAIAADISRGVDAKILEGIQ